MFLNMFIISILTYIFDLYIFSKICNITCKVNILLVLLFSIFSSFSVLFFGGWFKGLINLLLLFIIEFLDYKLSLKETFISTMFIYMLFIISEMFFSIIFIAMMKVNASFFIEDVFGIILVNIFEMAFILSLMKFTKINNFFNGILRWIGGFISVKLLYYLILFFALGYIFLYPIVFEEKSFIKVIVFFLSLIGILTFVIGFFKEKTGNSKLKNEYVSLLEYSRTFENDIIEKNKLHHEYKNQLILIRDMIDSKKAINYINRMIDNYNEYDDSKLLIRLKNIPSNGLKGFIYYKIKVILNNNIELYINVSDDVNWDQILYHLDDFSKILGVYIDNAIEASSNSLNKQIIIEFNDIEDSTEVLLSNTYGGTINFLEMDKYGYSTKNRKSGYGLSLVRDIFNKNDMFSQYREINGRFFVKHFLIKK